MCYCSASVCRSKWSVCLLWHGPIKEAGCRTALVNHIGSNGSDGVEADCNHLFDLGQLLLSVSGLRIQHSLTWKSTFIVCQIHNYYSVQSIFLLQNQEKIFLRYVNTFVLQFYWQIIAQSLRNNIKRKRQLQGGL